MPEFLVNSIAAVSGEPDLALGNIIGSNISNIALILGCSALVFPIDVSPKILRQEYPIMLCVMILFYVLALDGVISRWNGLFLVLCLVGIAIYLFIDEQNAAPLMSEAEDELQAGDPDAATASKAFYLIGGTVGLALGAHLMVDSALQIANSMGVEHVVVGLTIVAIGTSLPELAASMVGAFKNEADLSVGNVLGSNLLNVLFVVGVVSSIAPLDVEPTSIRVHFPVMIGFCVLLFPLAWTQYRISRMEGGVLLAGFVGYMSYLVLYL
jgi:cation:H+ antiporter